jgi:serine/threonine protein kinase
MLREEANVMEKLDHEHIVKLVGTYCIRHSELYLLLWPVAVCNLDNLFDDLDSLRTGQGDRDEILNRLDALGVTDVRALERNTHRQGGQPKTTTTSSQGNCPLKYLQQITGCITHAVAYCHGANIRHLDLKPSNILLSPGRVYLADFGIARDVNDRDHTMTFGLQGTPKWRAPEVCDPNDEWSMKAADVYSLGLVLLNIATVLYGADMAGFDRVVDELNPRARAQKLNQYYPTLEAIALSTQEVRDAKANTFAPRHIVDLTSRMLSSDPSQRPNASQVEAELVELGGIEQIYHSPCCKRSSRFMTERMDTRYKVVADERDRLAADCQRMAKRVEVLEGKDETYEERLKNERKTHAQNIAHLQEQLDKERKERNRLETLLAERRQRPGGIPRPGRSIAGGGNDAGSGLAMRTRPQTHPLPVAASPASFPSASAPAPKPQMRPLLACATSRVLQPTYSQAAAGGRLSSATVLRSSVRAGQDSPTRAMATTTDTGIPSPSPSPNPNGTGFSLRSRGSGSRLPRLVNPSTPIRSSTPTLQRDPSLTDSTQYSMSSSTFSRLSGLSRESESEVGSPAMLGITTTPSKGHTQTRRAAVEDKESQPDTDADPHSLNADVGLGLLHPNGGDLDATAKRDIDSTSTRDNANGDISSNDAPGPTSPALTASALSSPRSVKAELHPVGPPGAKVPPLPTAKSWADVARRERRA